jgi:hypothetical protein
MSGILAIILSCSTTLSWEATETDRVDSLEVILHGHDRLELYIESSRGIGSVTLDFMEPVQVDSIRITLMYDSLSPYRYCESMGLAFAGGGDSSLWMEDHSMIHLGEDGTVSLPADNWFVTLRLGWIDFYRQ